MHCGAEVTESSTNKQHHIYLQELPWESHPPWDMREKLTSVLLQENGVGEEFLFYETL